MRETLTDIKEKLRAGKYRNEEHVRLSLVCRLLFKLGWNIWDPSEVNTEFPAIPAEDRTKVDIALFAKEFQPSVFIEVKAVGKIGANLAEVERQVRDYNRNNTALFSVITDGTNWRLYYSQTAGEFHRKCFKECDLLEDDLDDLEQTFSLFLEKEHILSGHAETQARKYLQLTNMQKAVQDCLPQAKRSVQSPPYPSLPQAISRLLEEKGFDLSPDKAAELIEQIPESPPPVELGPTPSRPTPPQSTPSPGKPSSSLDPDNPGDLQFSRAEGVIGEKHGSNWNALVRVGIGLALERGYDVRTLNASLPANIKEGIYTQEGYHQVSGVNVSVQGMDINKAEDTLVRLARMLKCRLELDISWRSKSPRAGEQSFIRWSP